MFRKVKTTVLSSAARVSNIKYTIFNTHKRTSAYGVIDPVARMAINLNSNIVRHRTLFNYLSCNVRM